jgi:hypothetical protein
MSCHRYNFADELQHGKPFKMLVPPPHEKVARFEELFDPGRSLFAPS